MIDSFGPSRCMFESNFPVDKDSVSYRTLWNMFKRIANMKQLSESEKQVCMLIYIYPFFYVV